MIPPVLRSAARRGEGAVQLRGACGCALAFLQLSTLVGAIQGVVKKIIRKRKERKKGGIRRTRRKKKRRGPRPLGPHR